MLVLISLSLNYFFVNNFSMYIDPSAGSMFIAAIVGALVGVAMTLKLYWEKLKLRLSRKN